MHPFLLSVLHIKDQVIPTCTAVKSPCLQEPVVSCKDTTELLSHGVVAEVREG